MNATTTPHRIFAFVPGVIYPPAEPARKKKSWNALSDYEINLIHELAAQGVAYKDIGMKINRTADTVSVILRKKGIRKRKVRDDAGILRKTANPHLLPHA